MGPKPKSVTERFWPKVNKTEYCWEWTGSRSPNGYGRLNVNNKPMYAHRISWELHNTQPVGDLSVLHTCDNPCCVNPEHLWLGNHSDNGLDAYKKGRNPGFKVSYEDAAEIRELYATGLHTLMGLGKHYGVSHKTIWHIVNEGRRS